MKDHNKPLGVFDKNGKEYHEQDEVMWKGSKYKVFYSMNGFIIIEHPGGWYSLRPEEFEIISYKEICKIKEAKMTKLWFAYYGDKLAWTLIGITALYDPLMTGLRGFYEWNLGWKGYLVVFVIAPVIFQISKWCAKNL